MLNTFKLPNVYGIINVEDYSKGMIKAKINNLVNNSSDIIFLKENLKKIDAVKKFEADENTGIIKIKFDEDTIDASLMLGIVLNILGLDKEILKPKAGKVRKTIHQAYNVLDLTIYNKSRAYLDLKTAAGLLAAAVGVKKLMKNYFKFGGLAYIYLAYILLRDKNTD